MNFEKRICIFIKHFDCAMKTIHHFKMVPVINYMRGLEVKNRTFKVNNFTQGMEISPISIISNGVKLSKTLYGGYTDNQYTSYITAQYPLYQLGQKYNLNKPENRQQTSNYFFASAFYRGLMAESHISSASEGEKKLYNVGLFLLNKHFGCAYKYTNYGFLK